MRDLSAATEPKSPNYVLENLDSKPRALVKMVAVLLFLLHCFTGS